MSTARPMDIFDDPHVSVFTNGCFDILHAGHLDCLRWARMLGDSLTIGLNTDDSITRLKGHGRPVNTWRDRADLLLALDCVDRVEPMNSDHAGPLITRLKPDIYAKADDYRWETLHPDEQRAIQQVGARSVFIPRARDLSTTRIIRRLRTIGDAGPPRWTYGTIGHAAEVDF